MIDGILLIDKPQWWTSFDIVAKLRGALRQTKLGHGGTLDPLATGVLPIFLGKATRVVDMMPNQTKRYEAEMQLGITTDSYDITGQVLSTCTPNVTEADIAAVAGHFMGDITQIPPMYSAIKIGGKRLYQFAREGIEVERKPRHLHIYKFDWVFMGDKVKMDIHCSKGTYIRSICHDIGNMLGCGAAMSALRRTASSGFEIANCISHEEALDRAASGTIEPYLLPTDAAFAPLPRVDIEQSDAARLLTGVRLPAAPLGVERGSRYRFYCRGDFIGVGWAEPNGLIRFKSFVPC